ncbi:mitochondrial large ribosomal subunit [Marssonina coronariae]|uniref:Mitochondrial large ribosomal subunit n=1 Tax=Diplocarpon coronariae TaxID=2795749 RepID=A0A218ZFA4_9HELO|nr:mitochondrial large ribosomal subunit [Marssonina coronariae]
MSLNVPSRRVARSAAAFVSPRVSGSLFRPRAQRRSLSIYDMFNWRKAKDTGPKPTLPKNPLTEEYLKKKPAAAPPALVPGGLDSSSIFEDAEVAGPQAQSVGAGKPALRNRRSMAAALDPEPRARQRWERKMVIRDITKRGRLTKTQRLKREERVLVAKSHDFKMSVKKLMPLANQIAGKTVEEAIVQMRFSKKKAAKDVKEHLEHARNQAIVRRGMGLGIGTDEKFHPVTIMTKDGKRVKVTNPTTLYVDQAWVGRGKFTKTPDFRARGRVSMMINPTTGLTVVLKEEKTRIRLDQERKEKQAQRKVWVQLPDRPISAQRQYYSW